MYKISDVRRNAYRNRLSPKEEKKLHAQFMTGDHVARQRLVNSYLPVIWQKAYARDMPRGHSWDMFGVAVQAFMENLDQYDPARGCRLWTYMSYHVRYAVQEYAFANRTFFKMSSPKERAAFRNLETEARKLDTGGRLLNDRETRHIAEVFGVRQSVIHGLDDDMSAMRPSSLRHDRSGEQHGVEDPERAGGHLDFERRHDHDRNMQMLEKAMMLLDPRQAEIVRRRFKEIPDTLQDLSEDMGVSRERIRQIEVVALLKLRHAMENPNEQQLPGGALVRRYRRVEAGKGDVQVASPRRSNARKSVKRPGGRGPARKRTQLPAAAETAKQMDRSAA